MSEQLFIAIPFTPRDSFTDGIEGPACDAAGNVYAVNYARQGTIGKVTPNGEGSIFVELPKGSIGNGIRFNAGSSSGGEMFIADYTGHNILRVDMSTRAISVYAHDDALNQPNDLAITADGVLFASDPNWGDDTGQLWRVGHDGRFVLLEEKMGTTNGVEVSPDERTLYVNETAQQRIWAYDLSADGDISNKRLLIQFDEHFLDGMRCDVAGNLYVTRWGGGFVDKVSPAGEVVQKIMLHGKNCTNLTFGGPDGRTVYVTVADTGQIERFRADQPGRLTPPQHKP